MLKRILLKLFLCKLLLTKFYRFKEKISKSVHLNIN